MLKFGLPALIALCLLVLNAPGASAAQASLVPDPTSVSVNPNDTFTVTLKVTSDTDLASAQTNIVFDRQILQVQDIALATPWENALFLIGVAPNNTKALAMAQANNSTGKVFGAAAFYSSGAGTVPAGTADFLIVTMKAVAGGTSTISFDAEPAHDGEPAHLVRGTDAGGNVVPISTDPDVQVTVSGPTPAPTSTPSSTPTPTTPGQTPTPTATLAPSPTPTATPLPVHASMFVSPASLAVRPGAEFTVDVKQTTDQPTAGSQLSFGFDPNLLEIVSVTKGTAFSKANLVMGVAPVTGKAAVTAANTSGLLRGISAFLTPGSGSIAAGDATFVTIKFKAKGATGASDLKLSEIEMLRSGTGENIGVTGTNGRVEVSTNAPAVLPAGGGAPESGGWSYAGLAGALGVTALLAGVVALWTAAGRRRA